MKFIKIIQKLFLVCLIVAFCNNVAFAAERLKIMESNSFGKKSLVLEKWKGAEKKASLLGLSGKNELKAYKKLKFKDELVHTKYQQHYKGIPIHNAYSVATSKKNKTVHLFGSAVQGIDMEDYDITPAFSSNEALNYLKTLHKNELDLTPPIVYEREESKLMIYVDDKDQSILIYLVSFCAEDAENKSSRPFFIIDAKDKEVIKTWNGVSEIGGYYAESTGGNVQAGPHYWDFDSFDNIDGVCGCPVDYPPLELTYYDWFGTGYYYCEMKNNDARILSVDPWSEICIWNCGMIFDLQDDANGGYSPAVDVLGFVSVVHDMYSEWYDISDPINMSGISYPLRHVVYYDTPTSGKKAEWCGNKILFGNGDSDYHPFTSLNVVSHEMFHGRSDTHGGIGSIKIGDYRYLPHYGIEEAFCDLAGQAAEAYFYGEDNIDWYTGSRIRHTYPYYRRNMREPREGCGTSYPGCSIDIGDPVAYVRDDDNEYDYSEYYSEHGCRYFDGTVGDCDYHDVAGVFNKALYELAQSYGVKETFRCVLYGDAVWGHCLAGWQGESAFQGGANIIASTALLAYHYPLQPVWDAFQTVGVDAWW